MIGVFAPAPGIPGLHSALRRIFRLVPSICGEPVSVRAEPALTCYRGKTLSGDPRGEPVHAGSDIRLRRIVLDSSLLAKPREFARILMHELFHFVWVRLGNPSRRAFESLLAAEFCAGAEGELGWSAECRKQRITPADARHRTRRWREYACESFCDTGAWLCSQCGRHSEFTLASGYRKRRRAWLRALMARGAFSI